MADAPKFPATYKLEVDHSALALLIKGLSELPMKEVQTTLLGINQTIAEQNFAHEQALIQQAARDARLLIESEAKPTDVPGVVETELRQEVA